MNNKVLQQSVGKLVGQRNVFLFFSFFLTIAVILLSTLLFCKKERTIVLPTSGPSFWIEENRVSEIYLEKMGFFLSDLLLNRTPNDIERRNRAILEHVHPSSYHSFKKLLKLDQEEVLRNNKTFVFSTDVSYADLSRMTFVAEGESIAMVSKGSGAPFCTQKEKKKYTLGFRCEKGKLQLTSVKKEEA